MPRCHCSYCYEYGHNKMGCPKAKEHANDPSKGDGKLSPLQQYDEYCENQQIEEPWIGRVSNKYDWNYNTREAVSIQIEKRKRSRKVKRCRWCNGVGHNKRTCEHLKKIKKMAIDANNAYRAKALKELQELGVGAGALIEGKWEKYENGSWKSGKGIAVVAGINWRAINIGSRLAELSQSKSDFVKIRWAVGHSEEVSLPVEKRRKSDEYALSHGWSQEKKIITPTGSVQPPVGWLQSQDIKKGINSSFSSREMTSAEYSRKSWRYEELKTWAGYSIYEDD